MSLLIIQTGDAVSEARPLGNFNDWFTQSAEGVPVQTIDVHKAQPLPDAAQAIETFSHVIITGSSAMITEHPPWMIATQNWLEKTIEHIPTLGVCFGHQMLADMLGGTVDYNHKGRNMGLDNCQLTEAGQSHALFKDMQQPTFATWASHAQAVLKLPKDTQLLAQSAKDPHHAFQFGQHTFGLQFHPEWTGPIMAAYLNARNEDLTNEGFDVPAMLKNTTQDLKTDNIIKRFLRN